MFTIVVVLAMSAWLALLLLPTRSWLNGEVLDEVAESPIAAGRLTVVIPARNEAAFIADTVNALRAQAPELDVIVVDDHSGDGTADRVREADARVRVVHPASKPDGWSGKLWALQQGLGHVSTSLVLLLDADILIERGFLAAMLKEMQVRRVHMLSIMARLRNESFWEKLLIPAFVFFFKQIYPFKLSNSHRFRLAAAAGGCILLETNILHEIGGFAAIRDRIIDDCALARRVKDSGHRLWMGLSHRVVSRRAYDTLGAHWTMVDRTAYAQLGYSPVLLVICTVVMVTCFWMPVAGLVTPSTMPYSLIALAAMFMSYMPTLRFYRQSLLWSVLLPLIATLYLMMTWSSAIKHRYGQGVEWKGRRYA